MERNKIYHGDCASIMATWPDDCIDLTVTSPPYDNLRTYNGYKFDFEAIAQQLYRVTKVGGVVVWVVADATVDGSETFTSLRQALYFRDVCGFNAHDTMIYAKDAPQFPDTNRYANVCEYMFVFSKGAIKTFNPIRDRVNKSYGRKVTGTDREKNGVTRRKSCYGQDIYKFGARFNFWEIKTSKGNESTGHPAQFPEALARDHIISWSNPGDLVLDPMCGSGTTLKMAKELGRDFIGIDISQEYCDLAQRRVDGARVPLPGLVEAQPEKPEQPQLFNITQHVANVAPEPPTA